MKKTRIQMGFMVILIFMAGCLKGSDIAKDATFNDTKEIVVISREEGSGTRGAFIELFGIEVKDGDGNKKDRTTKEAIIAKQTDVMIQNIVGNKYAIGYISLGSLNDTVKVLQIDGVEASAENVKNGSYTIARPFNLATKGDLTELTKDFIDFIMSDEGQTMISKSYISVVNEAGSYMGDRPSGKIVVAGSSSVTPIMEKLKEAYLELNPNAIIEIQQSDSSAGMIGVIDGTCDIGMASRALKESELVELTSVQIALDGIAVIINNENPLSELTFEQVKSIFIEEITKWNELQK